MIKHIRINLDETIATTTCVVFIYLFNCNQRALERLQYAIVQVEHNLQVAVQTPIQVYWSQNSQRGMADTVTVTKTSDRPKIQLYSATEFLNYVPTLELQDHAAQTEVRLEQANNPPAQPIAPIVPSIVSRVSPIVTIEQPAASSERIANSTAQQATASNDIFVFDEKYKKQNLSFF